ncbi:DUF4760 domain-containing protein [Methylobacterium sp. NEAU 140]|uniref:DUF4760 domain-containing protein n=1 Tax=Methylobacterium sp. NEAU 140 TaxID=3064945 RepID=UPI0027346571|nr:DUF4760 domain-containing protein [Methylobacterium sp. NEAU 140]MDP4026630.1 DUF4760 domain-containing protein [Methylobacterium sp. NEAU 140]
MTTDAILVGLAGPAAALLGIAVSAYFVLKQMKLTHELAMRNKSLDYSLFADQRIIDARLNIEEVFGSIYARSEPIDIRLIEKKDADEEDPNCKVRTSILTILAHWENMALAIDANIASEDVCFEMVATTLDQHVRIFRSFIEKRRQDNPRSYYHLMALRRRWEDKLSQVYIEKFPSLIKPKT